MILIAAMWVIFAIIVKVVSPMDKPTVVISCIASMSYSFVYIFG